MLTDEILRDFDKGVGRKKFGSCLLYCDDGFGHRKYTPEGLDRQKSVPTFIPSGYVRIVFLERKPERIKG